MAQAGSLQCAGDCACAEPPEPEPLLLDTNVLSALARIACHVAAAGSAGSAEEVFRALLAALTCCGQRPLLLARDQLVNEIEGGKRKPFEYALLPPTIFRELFRLCDGAPKPHWEAEHEGDTDRAILASALAYGGGVTIVTVDARFLRWVMGTWVAGESGDVTAMDGIELLGRLTACLAVSEDVFAAAEECEVAFLDERVLDSNDNYDEARAERRRESWRKVQIEVVWRLHKGDRQGGPAWDL